MIPRLHIVTDDAVLHQSNFMTTATRLLRALDQRVALHIRGRSTSAQDLFEIVSRLRGQGGHVFVNDRLDIAITTGAAGVHLGARSLPISVVRRIRPGLTIGYSAHRAEECADAERDGADFVFAGSIYQTASHPDRTPGGIALLQKCVGATGIPVVAIGGVTPERVAETMRSGAHGVAVIRAVWSAPDPVPAAQQLTRLLYDDDQS